MSEICKEISPGFELIIVKRLQERLIDFIVSNDTEFVFLFQFAIKDSINVASVDDEMEKVVQVMPRTRFKYMQLSVTGSFSYKYDYKYQKLHFEPIVKHIEVASDLILTITQTDMEQKIIFELDNKSEIQAHFELTVLELSGIRTFNGKNLFIIEVQAKAKEFVCELNFEGVWSYKYSYNFMYAGNNSDETVVASEASS